MRKIWTDYGFFKIFAKYDRDLWRHYELKRHQLKTCFCKILLNTNQHAKFGVHVTSSVWS